MQGLVRNYVGNPEENNLANGDRVDEYLLSPALLNRFFLDAMSARQVFQEQVDYFGRLLQAHFGIHRLVRLSHVFTYFYQHPVATRRRIILETAWRGNGFDILGCSGLKRTSKISDKCFRYESVEFQLW